jgi:tRNA-dihydrouridine synthase B
MLPQPEQNNTEYKSTSIARPILRGAVNFPVMLAPMVGLSHVALRVAIREYLPNGAITMWPTEMLNSRRLPAERFDLVPEVLRGREESHLVPQILGNEEDPIRKSVHRLESEWGASGIDINMGCPVRKALSHNYGVSLMGDKSYAAEVVRMTVRHTELPVSVKLRAGKGDSGLQFLLDFAVGLVEAGAEALTLHPRSAEQKRRGKADWDQIRILREHVPCAVIGNGDVQTADDAIRMLNETKCDAVMIGRAMTARPWLFWQIAEDLWLKKPVASGHLAPEPPPGRAGERAPRTPEEEAREYARFALRVLKLLRDFHPPRDKAHWSEELLIRKYRFFLKNSAPWLQFGHELEARASRASSIQNMEDIVSNFFFGPHSLPQSMSSRTDLRY